MYARFHGPGVVIGTIRIQEVRIRGFATDTQYQSLSLIVSRPKYALGVFL